MGEKKIRGWRNICNTFNNKGNKKEKFKKNLWRRTLNKSGSLLKKKMHIRNAVGNVLVC